MSGLSFKRKQNLEIQGKKLHQEGREEGGGGERVGASAIWQILMSRGKPERRPRFKSIAPLRAALVKGEPMTSFVTRLAKYQRVNLELAKARKRPTEHVRRRRVGAAKWKLADPKVGSFRTPASVPNCRSAWHRWFIPLRSLKRGNKAPWPLTRAETASELRKVRADGRVRAFTAFVTDDLIITARVAA